VKSLCVVPSLEIAIPERDSPRSSGESKQPPVLAELMIIGGQNGYAVGSFGGSVFAATGLATYIFEANFLSVSVNGLTFTLSNVDTSGFIESATTMSPYAITSGSMTFTLSPQGAPTLGSVTGSFSLTSPLTTLTGTISGTYSAVE
jgi:hypothetical protein